MKVSGYIIYGQKMNTVKCECFEHVLEHIPIMDLANIIHEYAAAEPRADRNCMNINVSDYEYSIYTCTGHLSICPAIYIDRIISKRLSHRFVCWLIYMSKNESWNLCADIFSYASRSKWWKIRDACVAFDQLADIAYQTILAEETGGHLHPDPRC